MDTYGPEPKPFEQLWDTVRQNGTRLAETSFRYSRKNCKIASNVDALSFWQFCQVLIASCGALMLSRLFALWFFERQSDSIRQKSFGQQRAFDFWMMQMSASSDVAALITQGHPSSLIPARSTISCNRQ